MKKFKMITIIGFLALVGLLLSGCATAGSTKSDTKEVIMDDEPCLVEYRGFVADKSDENVLLLYLYVENKSDQDILLDLRDIRLSDCVMPYNGGSITISDHTNWDSLQQSVYKINTKEFARYGLDAITSVKFGCYILNSEGAAIYQKNFETKANQKIDLSDASSYKIQQELVNEQGFKVSYCGMIQSQDSKETIIDLFIENNRDSEINYSVAASDMLQVKINDIEVTVLNNGRFVPAHSQYLSSANNDCTIENDKMKDKGINAFDTISFGLEITDGDGNVLFKEPIMIK